MLFLNSSIRHNVSNGEQDDWFLDQEERDFNLCAPALLTCRQFFNYSFIYLLQKIENLLQSIINFNIQLQIISAKNTIARGVGFFRNTLFRKFQNNQLTALNVANNHEVIIKVKPHDSRKRKAENGLPTTDDLWISFFFKVFRNWIFVSCFAFSAVTGWHTKKSRTAITLYSPPQ